MGESDAGPGRGWGCNNPSAPASGGSVGSGVESQRSKGQQH